MNVEHEFHLFSESQQHQRWEGFVPFVVANAPTRWWSWFDLITANEIKSLCAPQLLSATGRFGWHWLMQIFIGPNDDDVGGEIYVVWSRLVTAAQLNLAWHLSLSLVVLLFLCLFWLFATRGHASAKVGLRGLISDKMDYLLFKHVHRTRHVGKSRKLRNGGARVPFYAAAPSVGR